MDSEKRYSEFLGGPGKRYSEFLGGPGKRYSEFLGGPGKKSELAFGGVTIRPPLEYADAPMKRWSEFLGGPGKRYRNTSPGFLLAKKVAQLFKPAKGGRDDLGEEVPLYWDKVQPGGSEFLGGPGR